MKYRRPHIKKKKKTETRKPTTSYRKELRERGKKEIGEKINSIILHRRI